MKNHSSKKNIDIRLKRRFAGIKQLLNYEISGVMQEILQILFCKIGVLTLFSFKVWGNDIPPQTSRKKIHFSPLTHFSPILDDCRLLVTRIPQIQFKHCFRQANRCADFLARMSSSLDIDFSALSSPPVDILNVFEDDCNGVFCSKVCFSPVAPV